MNWGSDSVWHSLGLHNNWTDRPKLRNREDRDSENNRWETNSSCPSNKWSRSLNPIKNKPPYHHLNTHQFGIASDLIYHYYEATNSLLHTYINMSKRPALIASYLKDLMLLQTYFDDTFWTWIEPDISIMNPLAWDKFWGWEPLSYW